MKFYCPLVQGREVPGSRFTVTGSEFTGSGSRFAVVFRAHALADAQMNRRVTHHVDRSNKSKGPI